MRLFSLAAFLLISGILLLGCTSSYSTASPTPQISIPPATSTPVPTAQSAQTPTPTDTQMQNSPSPTPTSTPSSAASPIPTGIDEKPPQVQEFTVTAKQWEFIPDTITVRKDLPVRLIVTSIDVDHGIAIPEFGVNQQLSPGSTEIIEFTPDKAGEFSMSCSVYCGAGHTHMTGTLIVTE